MLASLLPRSHLHAAQAILFVLLFEAQTKAAASSAKFGKSSVPLVADCCPLASRQATAGASRSEPSHWAFADASTGQLFLLDRAHGGVCYTSVSPTSLHGTVGMCCAHHARVMLRIGSACLAKLQHVRRSALLHGAAGHAWHAIRASGGQWEAGDAQRVLLQLAAS